MSKLLTPEEFSVKNVFDGGKYIIPVYQRPYSWGENQVKQLLKDIDETYHAYKNYKVDSNAQEPSELFAGTFFMKTIKMIKNKIRVWEVVDGQQRITTFTLILMCLLNKLNSIADTDDRETKSRKNRIIDEIRGYLWKAPDVLEDKNERVLTLGGIDKNILNEVFDELFWEKNIVNFSNNKLKTNINDIEKNLLKNVIIIDGHFQGYGVDDCIDYFGCISNYVKFVNIATEVDLPKLFSIFESINSKGKPLDDIDLIKSYIFQHLSISDYDEYLRKWGSLIIETNDNLMDYLTVYVRANIIYCANAIKLVNFKSLVGNGLTNYFGTKSVPSTLKALIDDLVNNVGFYRDIVFVRDDIDLHIKAILRMNVATQYNHDKALYFKLLSMVKENSLPVAIAANIMKKAFCFILTFQSICSRESKKTLKVFAEVQNILYGMLRTKNTKLDLKDENFKQIERIFERHIVENNINDELIAAAIEREITYESSYVTKTILAYLDSLNSDGTLQTMNLCQLLKAGKDLTLDHILPQNPNKDDYHYKYCVNPTNKDLIMLKGGQDFTADDCLHMQKDDFYKKYLHILGNMRLEWRDENSKKNNSCVVLPEFNSNFCTFADVKNRTKELIDKLFQSKLLLSANSIESDVYQDDKLTVDNVSITEPDVTFKSDKYKPISFDLLGDEISLRENSYRMLAVQVMEQLYIADNIGIEKLAREKFSFTRSERIAISDDANDIKGTVQTITDKVYIDTNYASSYIISLLYCVIKATGLSNGDLVIHFVKR